MRPVATQDCSKKRWRSSRGQLILCDLARGPIQESARGLELNDLAEVHVAESQSTRAGDEDVEDRPAEAEAAPFTWEAADHPRSPPHLLERPLQQV